MHDGIRAVQQRINSRGVGKVTLHRRLIPVRLQRHNIGHNQLSAKLRQWRTHSPSKFSGSAGEHYFFDHDAVLQGLLRSNLVLLDERAPTRQFN